MKKFIIKGTKDDMKWLLTSILVLFSFTLCAEVISGPEPYDEVNNNGGVFENTTYSIDISAHTDISWTMTWGETGNLENADRIRIRYRIDGGPWTTVVSQNSDVCPGGGACPGVGTGAAGLEGDLLEVRIRARNDNNSEYWWWQDLTVSGTPIPLPVELLYFKAKIESTRTYFEWKTASEINNDYFEIEHSVDGVTYTPITFIVGAGNSMTPILYSIESNALSGDNYYRLKQVDFDGTYSYSKLLYISNNISKEIISIYDINYNIVPINTSGFIIIQYSDGSTKKIINP